MEVVITGTNTVAKDLSNDRFYAVDGIEIERENGDKVYYDKSSNFYQTLVWNGYKSKAKILSGNIITLI